MGFRYQQGEIVPGNTALVLKGNQNHIVADTMLWGMHKIINARSETVLKKKMFQKGIHSGRIVIPATSFYEWDAFKTKVTFSRFDNDLIYMAGISDENGFVILTTRPNPSIQDVHDRMPLVLEKKDVYRWLFEDYEKLLEIVPAALQSDQKYKQGTLF